MSAQLADLYFDSESYPDEHEALSDLFGSLKISTHSPVTSLLLNEIYNLILYGESITGFFESSKSLQNTKVLLKSVLDKISDIQTLSEGALYHHPNTKLSKPVNILLQYDPQQPVLNEMSSSLQGLKLVFLSLMVLPKERVGNLNLEKLIHSFNSNLKKLTHYSGLNLDFSKGATVNFLIDKCEFLVETDFKNPATPHRIFLDFLRKSLVILKGGKFNDPIPRGRSQLKKDALAPHDRTSQTVRHAPFWIPDTDGISDEYVEIISDPGEESALGLLEPEEEDESDIDLINPEDDLDEQLDDIASAKSSTAQVKNKYWMQSFNRAFPWGSYGINPSTRIFLINWIKENKTPISLVFALMLATGKRLEKILQLTVGVDGVISSTGLYSREYIPPENHFKPKDGHIGLVEVTTELIHFQLPDVISNVINEKCTALEGTYSIANIFHLEPETFKKEIQKKVKELIRKGAQGLATDRIHLSLIKQISELTSDQSIAYIIAGDIDDMPPVSSYYSAFSHKDLQDIYFNAVKDLYLEH